MSVKWSVRYDGFADVWMSVRSTTGIGSDAFIVETFRLKSDAKSFTKQKAKEENALFVSYTKQDKNPRIAYQKDYGE